MEGWRVREYLRLGGGGLTGERKGPREEVGEKREGKRTNKTVS